MNLGSTCAFLFALALASPPAYAQSFPSKPIRLVIGSYPGGGIDLAGRIIALKMSENLGQQVIVDNRGGANGIIGMDLVAKAAPDGHTFYMGTAGHISVNPVIHSKLPFNVDRDFTPLTQVVSLPFLVYLHPSLPIKTLGDLTSGEIVRRLHTEMVKAMNTPDVRAKLAANGFDTGGSTPEQFGAFRKAEEARWGRVIRQAGINQQ